jgi:hypothetical protein
MPPSYQKMLNGPWVSLAANLYWVIEASGAVSLLISLGRCQLVEQASTQTGSPIFIALKMPESSWQPMSPSTPVPKSHQPRQAKG